MKRLNKPNWQRKEEKRKSFWLVLLCAFLLVPLSVGAYFIGGTFLTVDKITVSGSTIYVRAGGDLQAAIERARNGDTIVLQAGASFVGSFVLPNKTGTEFVTIQSSEIDKLPNDLTRVSPKDAALMPKILSSGGGEPAIKTAPGAHHYRFIGIEFAPARDDYVYNLIALGTDSQTLSEMPKNLEFDRCYIHPNPKGKTRRGIMLNSAETVIKNSYIAGFGYEQEETQAIAGWNGAGGYQIINNYLEAGAENIMFGGADPSVKNLVPADIEIRRNLLSKPAEWRGRVGIKCLFELKNARNVRIIGNILENSFDENAVRLTVRNQNGTAPWSTIEDVTFQNNIVRNSGGGINFLGRDDANPSAVMRRVAVTNNLFENIDSQKFGADGRFITVSGGEDLTVVNNTVFHDGNVITAHGEATKRFGFRGNIFSNNNYGFVADGLIGKSVLAKFFADGDFSGNLVINGKNISKSDIYLPPGNILIDNFNAAGFLGWQTGNYRFAANSKFKDRKIGCDFDALEAEIKKVMPKQ